MATVTKPPILDETGQDILTQLRRIADAKESNLMGYGGAVNFADLPSPTVTNLNLFYLIKDSFTTDSNFVVGPGVSESGGKYWAVINIGTDASPVCKYDELGTLIDLSSKQDKALSTPIVIDGVTITTVENALIALETLADKNKDDIGTLSSLNTTVKNNLVSAINEIKNATDNKVNSKQGIANAGKVMVVDPTGLVVPSTVTDANVLVAYGAYTIPSGAAFGNEYCDVSIDLTSGTYMVKTFSTDDTATRKSITYDSTLKFLRVYFDQRPSSDCTVWVEARKVA